MDTPEILINCWGFYSLSSQLFVIFVDGCLPYRADMGRAVRRIVRVNVTIGCLHVAVAFQQIVYVPQKRVFLGSKGRARFWRWTASPLIPARAVRMKAGKDPSHLAQGQVLIVCSYARGNSPYLSLIWMSVCC